ncbi:hypothetical protein [Luteococcus sp. OSA5]|uniref:hypothetical protein n=1 Tax=Luteococcus sp. OSA5 TaxID=3401630 RepID=UPI003B43755F
MIPLLTLLLLTWCLATWAWLHDGAKEVSSTIDVLLGESPRQADDEGQRHVA